MSPNDALPVLRRLRDGRDPSTGTRLPLDHLCQRADVLRALFTAVAVMESPGMPSASFPSRDEWDRPHSAVDDAEGTGGVAATSAPPDRGGPEGAIRAGPPNGRAPRPRAPNAGQPWNEDDDLRLAEAFDGGADEKELAAAFGRSRTSIRARLIRLGRGPLLGAGPAPRYPVAEPLGEEREDLGDLDVTAEVVVPGATGGGPAGADTGADAGADARAEGLRHEPSRTRDHDMADSVALG